MKQEKIWKGYEQPKPSTENLTGIPIQMKMDFEHRSGLSFDDVRVHYNSDKPAKVGALAYTQGNQVHIGPGQERYLKHELGHVVQQKIAQIPTSGYRNGYRVNTSHHLEYMADHIPHFVTSASRPAIVSNQPMQLADFSASVSLVVNNQNFLQDIFYSSQLLVDTIKLTGRAETGLWNDNRNKTQGDHTIADAAIKKHQKILLRGREVRDLLHFYDMHSRILLQENSFEGWSEEPRAKEARKMANALIQRTKEEEGNTHTITGWRSIISRIIVDYNTAYSHGMLATRGKGTGGKGESSGIEGIRRLKFQNISESLYGISQNRLDKLLDIEPKTLREVFGDNTIRVANYLRLKMLVMLSQLTGYHGHSTPEASDEKVFAGKKPDVQAPEEALPIKEIRNFAPHATETTFKFLAEFNLYDIPEDELLSNEELLEMLSDNGIKTALSVLEE